MAQETEVLRLVFRNEESRMVTINVADPREDVTEGEITECMDAILAANIFTTTGGDIVEKVRGEIVTRTVDVLYEPGEE